jgi:chitodextrinase
VLIVSILGVKILMGSQAATGATMSMKTSSTSLAPGSTFSVTLSEDSGTDLVNSVQASLSYDAAQLQYVSITNGTAFPTVAANSTSTPGIVRVGRAATTPVSGVKDIVTVNFTVLASSGTIGLTYDKNFSFVVRSTDNTDILTTTTGLSLPVSGGSTASASMSLSPASGNVAAGSTFTVTVRENSGTSAVNTVQTAITYDPAKLQYVSMAEGNVFTNIAATDTVTAGRVRVARAVQAGSAGVSGDNPVVVLTFKALSASGATSLTIDKTQSYVNLASTSANILGTVAGSTFTIASAPAPASATLSLSPTSGSFANGSTVAVTVKATSTAAPMTTVQSTINYPAAQLQYVSTTEGGVFPTAQRTNTATSGVIDIIRSLPGGSDGVTGANNVVTISFKVIGTTGAAALTFGNTSAIYDDSGTGTNILSIVNSTAANYTVASPQPTCTGNPSQPTALTRTSTNYTTLGLSWTASTPASGCTLAGYHILRGGVSIGDVTTGTTFTDSGLVSGTNYVYSIQAFDTAGRVSTASTAVTMTTKADDQSPTAPAGVTAAAPGAVSVNLSWNPSTDYPIPGGVGLAGYRIYRNNATTPTYTVTNGTTYTDTNVTASTTYGYTVTAYDNLGNESAPSNVVSARTATGTVACTGNPTVPTALASGASTMTTTSLSWTASTPASGCTLAGYRILRNSTVIGSSATTSFSDTGLTPNTSYTYAVQAYDANGNVSALSTARTVVTASDTTAPAAPTGVTGTAVSPGQVTLAWTASTDNVAVTGYKVYRGTTLLTTTSATARTYNDTTVSADTSYVYTVSAIDGAGNESTKTAATPNPVRTPIATDATAPSAPASLRTVTITTRSVALTWNASNDNTAVTGYHVYRNGALIGDATGLSYTNTGLTANTAYVYTVKAFDRAGNTSAASNALTVTTLTPTGTELGDFNGNGMVDLSDLSTLLTHWQERNVPIRYGDLNQDGIVDRTDLSTLLSYLGEKV